ncbi:MAG: DUF6326 family protein [Sulfurovum sp.]|nr:DUF6326 family protein [Sulfurovum sp.]
MNDIKIKLSLLWIVVMLNMVFADIVGLLNAGTIEEMMNMNLPQSMLLVFSFLLEIPIVMIFLSYTLQSIKINYYANTTAAIITMIWIIAGGNTSLSYIFFASVEVLCMLLIIMYARKLSTMSKKI